MCARMCGCARMCVCVRASVCVYVCVRPCLCVYGRVNNVVFGESAWKERFVSRLLVRRSSFVVLPLENISGEELL